jgi:hypothetical protein
MAVVGDHGDRGWRLADHEVVGVDDIHHPAVGAEVVDVQDAFGLGDSATWQASASWPRWWR